jgi:hypothetical protein
MLFNKRSRFIPILVVNKSLCGIPQLRLPELPDVFLDTKT